MNRPRICAVLVNADMDAARAAAELADMYEVRIDLIGEGWAELVAGLTLPWMACNRIATEGGGWQGDEKTRTDELVRAAEMGADIVDVELQTKDLGYVVQAIKERAECLISHHDMTTTPRLNHLAEIAQRQVEAEADICKIVTTAHNTNDCATTLRLIDSLPKTRIVSFAMGPEGLASRICCPLVGGEFTYASTAIGTESAPGQLTVARLRKIYDMMAK